MIKVSVGELSKEELVILFKKFMNGESFILMKDLESHYNKQLELWVSAKKV